MPKYEFRTPDGGVYEVDSPSELTTDQLTQIASDPSPFMPQAAPSDAPADPTAGMDVLTGQVPGVPGTPTAPSVAEILAARSLPPPTEPEFGIPDLLQATGAETMRAMNRLWSDSALTAAALTHGPISNLASGQGLTLSPGENYRRFREGPVGRSMRDLAQEGDSYWRALAGDVPESMRKPVEFAGSTFGSTISSLPVMVGGVPGLAAMSMATFDPAFSDAIDKGASPDRAFAHALISTGAEMGSEYLGSAWARTGRILGTQPFVPPRLRQFLSQAPRGALEEAMNDASRGILRTMGRSAMSEGMEEAVSQTVQRLSAAALYDPSQITNVSDFLTDVGMSFLGGAAGGALFTPIEMHGARQKLRHEIQQGIVRQWDSAIELARKDGALRPEDEKQTEQAQLLRFAMERAARTGQADVVEAARAKLETLVGKPMADATVAEVTGAAQAYQAMSTPESAQRFLAEARQRWGEDSPSTRRVQEMVETGRQLHEIQAARGGPRTAEMRPDEWAAIAKAEGVDLSKIEFREGRGYVDANGAPTDNRVDASGTINPEVEAWVDPQTGRIVVHKGSIRGDMPGLNQRSKRRRQREQFRQIIREELAHTALQTPEGKERMRAYYMDQLSGPNGASVLSRINELATRFGYDPSMVREEALAKLYREDTTWHRLTDRFIARLQRWFPRLGQISPERAGRMLARQLVRDGAAGILSGTGSAAARVGTTGRVRTLGRIIERLEKRLARAEQQQAKAAQEQAAPVQEPAPAVQSEAAPAQSEAAVQPEAQPSQEKPAPSQEKPEPVQPAGPTQRETEQAGEIEKLRRDLEQAKTELEQAKKEAGDAQAAIVRKEQEGRAAENEPSPKMLAAIDRWRGVMADARAELDLAKTPEERQAAIQKWLPRVEQARRFVAAARNLFEESGIDPAKYLSNLPNVDDFVEPPVQAAPETPVEAGRERLTDDEREMMAHYPEGTIQIGKATTIYGSNRAKIRARYAWIRIDQVHASHMPQAGFAPDPAYAPLINTRDYQNNPAETSKVLTTAQMWEPELAVTDAAAADQGVPIVVPSPEFQNGQPTGRWIFRVAGGNGRFQAMQSLTSEQVDEHHRVSNERAEGLFGLTQAPDGYAIFRVVEPNSLATEAEVKAANVLIHTLNPSSGQAQTPEEMAAGDAKMVPEHIPYETLLLADPRGEDEDLAQWLGAQISANLIDRSSHVTLTNPTADQSRRNYIRTLFLHVAYGNNPGVLRMAADPRVGAIERGLLFDSAKLAVEFRQKGAPEIADAFGQMLQRVMDQRRLYRTTRDIGKILGNIGSQIEFDAGVTPQVANICRMAAALLAQDVAYQTTAKGKKVADSTADNWNETLSGWAAKVHDIVRSSEADMFGQTTTVADQFEAYMRGQIGPVAASRKESEFQPDPRVREWKRLARLRATQPLTQAQTRRMETLERQLGQSFMAFFGPQEEAVLARQFVERLRRKKVRPPALVAPPDPAVSIQQTLLEGRPWVMNPDGILLPDVTAEEEQQLRQDLREDDLFGPGQGGFTSTKKKKPRDLNKPNVEVIGPRKKAEAQPELTFQPDAPKRKSAEIQKAPVPTRAAVPARPEIIDWTNTKFGGELAEHQKEGVDRIIGAWDNPDRQKRNFGLFDGTGAGKTRQELAVAKIASEGRYPGPVLIVTENDRIIDNAFAKEAEIIGVRLWRYYGGNVPADGVAICTYHDFSRELIKPGLFKTVIYDEAHNLRGEAKDSARAISGRKVEEAADRVLFATATPLDRPEQLWYLKSLLEESPESALARVGIKVETMIQDGEMKYVFSADDEADYVNIADQLEKIFDKAFAHGRAIKREVPLDNLEVRITHVQLTPDEHEYVKQRMDEAEEWATMNIVDQRARKGFVLMRGREALEFCKLRVAVHEISKAVRAGRSVVVFGYRSRESEWGEPTLVALADMLANEFGPQSVGRLFGRSGTEADKLYVANTVKRFQAGEMPIILATPQMGGTGINLDDVVGDRPREICMLSAPFSSLETAQIAGRIARLTTVGNAFMTYLLSQHKVDRWNFGISLEKLKRLGAVVKGDIEKLEPDEPESHNMGPESIRRREAALKGLVAGYTISAAPTLPAGHIRRAGYPDVWMRAGLRPRPGGFETLPTPKIDVEGVDIRTRLLRATLWNDTVNLIGASVATPEDMAAAAQVLRNPGFEVMRWILTKANRIVSVMSVSTRTPDVVQMFAQPRDVMVLQKLLRETEADGFYMMHNHPSGMVTPSDADIAATRAIKHYPFGKLFRGHLVIDHWRYSVIAADGQYGTHAIPGVAPEDPMIGPVSLLATTPEERAALEGNPEGESAVAAFGAALNRQTNRVTVLILDSHNRVRAVVEIPATRPAHEIRRATRTTVQLHGGATAHAIYSGANPEVAEALKRMTATVFASVQIWSPSGGLMPLAMVSNPRRALTSERENQFEQQTHEEAQARIEPPSRVSVAFSRKRLDNQGDLFGGQEFAPVPRKVPIFSKPPESPRGQSAVLFAREHEANNAAARRGEIGLDQYIGRSRRIARLIERLISGEGNDVGPMPVDEVVQAINAVGPSSSGAAALMTGLVRANRWASVRALFEGGSVAATHGGEIADFLVNKPSYGALVRLEELLEAPPQVLWRMTPTNPHFVRAATRNELKLATSPDAVAHAMDLGRPDFIRWAAGKSGPTRLEYDQMPEGPLGKRSWESFEEIRAEGRAASRLIAKTGLTAGQFWDAVRSGDASLVNRLALRPDPRRKKWADQGRATGPLPDADVTDHPEQGGFAFSRKAQDELFGDKVLQRYTSAETALPNNRPAVFAAIARIGGWKPGAVNVDFGAGRSTWMDDALAGRGVLNLRYDPFHETSEVNLQTVTRAIENPADTVTVANVLNVVYPEAAMQQTIRQAARLLKPEGRAFFWVHYDPKKQAGRPAGRNDSWQWHQRPDWYVPRIEEFFRTVEVAGPHLVIASEPIPAEGEWTPAAGTGVAFSRKPSAYAQTPSGGDPNVARIGYITGKHSAKIQARAIERGDIGLLVTPATAHNLDAARSYPFFAVDNGVFGRAGFNEPAFMKLLGRLKPGEERLLFVVAPDVVGNAEATLERFRTWGPRIRQMGLPVAMAAQDGLEDRFDQVPWDDIDVLFIGGSTAWKIGEFEDPERRRRWEHLIAEAHAREIPIHMGRVNSNKRLTGHAIDMGAATADGTMLAYAPDRGLSELESWLDQINQMGLVWAARHFEELGRLPTAQEIYEVAAEIESMSADLGAYEPAREQIADARRALGLMPVRQRTVSPATDGQQQEFAFSRRMVRSFRTLEEGVLKFESWRDWYEQERQTINEMFGDQADLFSRFLAATSANATVPANVSLALKAFTQHVQGLPFDGYLGTVVANLERAVAGEDLAGPKIEPFSRALAGDENAIAVDRHVIEAIFGKGVRPDPKTIQKAQNVIQRIAKKHGWTPRETQAALWAWNIARRGDTPRRYREFFPGSGGAEAGRGAVPGLLGRSDTGPGIAYSLKTPADHRPVETDLAEFRKDFPTAPEIVIEPTGDQAATWDSQKRRIVVSPTWMPNSRARRRGLLLAALTDAGVQFIRPEFWETAWGDIAKADPTLLSQTARRLRVDPATEDGRKQILAQLVRDRRSVPSPFGIVRSLLRFVHAIEGPGSAGRVITAMQRALEGQVASFTIKTPREFALASQDQVRADLNASIYHAIQPVVARLDDMVRSISESELEGDLFGRITLRLRQLADSAEAASLVTPSGRRRPRISDSDFITQVSKLGIRIEPRDVRDHNAYLAEMAARRAHALQLALESNLRTRTYLAQNAPEDEFGPMKKKLDEQIERQERALLRIQTNQPAIWDRAVEIRIRLDQRPDGRAAQAVLADPQVQEWIEIVREIDDSGATPRVPDAMTPELRNASNTVGGMFRHSVLAFRRQATEQLGRVTDQNLAKLREIHAQRLATRKQAGEVQVGIIELMQALLGDTGASGGLFTRDVAKRIRDQDRAIARFAVALGASRPTASVLAVRQAFMEGGDLKLEGAVIRQAAIDGGIAETVLQEMLEMAQDVPDFRNFVLMLADEANDREDHNLLTTIQALEQARADALAGKPLTSRLLTEANRRAWEVAAPALRRLRLESRALRKTTAALDSEIEDLQVQIRAAQMMVEAAEEADASTANTNPESLGVVEMVYRTDNGEYMAPFVRADGKPQQEVRVAPNQGYTREKIRQIMEWREQALLAVQAGSNPPHVTRGLEIGAQAAVTMIDAGSTPGQIVRTLSPGLASEAWTRLPMGIRSAIPRLVPGIMGRRLADEMARYARAGNKIDALLDRNHGRRMEFLRAAYQSMGLSHLDSQHQRRFAESYSQTAHRLRQFGSNVAAGDTLFLSNGFQQVTTELLSLIRFDRQVFRQAQEVMASERYGGIREQFGEQRLIRPPAETGDVGLARMADRSTELLLAGELTEAEAEAKRTGKPLDMVPFWDRNMAAVLTHLFDSDRTDLAFERNPMLRALEIRYAHDIRAGRSPVPQSVNDVVAALAGYAGNTIANAPQTIRDLLVGEELDRYARVARSRVSSRRASTAAKDASGTYIGEDDTNEFTSPAAKLIYPSAWYHYGAENDLRAAVERIADPAQVAMLDALANAASSLAEARRRIDLGLGHLGPEDLDLIRWHTPHFEGDITPERMRAAVSAIEARERIVRAEAEKLRLAAVQSGTVGKLIRATFPFILGWPRAMLTNVMGGPVSGLFVFAPVLGRGRSMLMTIPLAVGSSANLAAELTYWAASKLGLELPGENRREALEWLETLGLGLSYSHAEIQEMAGHMIAPGLRKAAIRTVARAADLAEQTIGRHIGVAAGDLALNRFCAQFVVPMVLWRMKTMALRWQARLARENVTAGVTDNPAHTFGPADSDNWQAISEQLREAGLNPEQFLAELANGRVDVRKFWRNELGAMFGQAIIGEFNAATRINRPHPNSLLGLLGWTSATISRALDLMRSPSDIGRLRKWMGAAISAGSIAATFAFSAYFQALGRQGFNEAQSALARALSEALQAPPPPDDDEASWLDWIRNLMARAAAAFEVDASPKLMPWEKSWWARPASQIALELALSPMVGIGVDRVVDGGSLKVPVLGMAFQVLESMGYGVKSIWDLMGGHNVEAATNAKLAFRNAASAFGEWGRATSNFLMPPRRKSVHDIRAAANDTGVLYNPPQAPAGLGFTQNTPTRMPLLNAAVGLANARTDDQRKAATDEVREVGRSIYQAAYDRTIQRGGFDSPTEARVAADEAGRRAVQSALTQIEPVTRALGRSVTAAEYEKLKATGVLDTKDVKTETAAVKAAAGVLEATRSPMGNPLANNTEAVGSPIRASDLGGGGRYGGGGYGGGGGTRLPRTRRLRVGRVGRVKVGRLKVRSSRISIPKAKKIRLRVPKA